MGNEDVARVDGQLLTTAEAACLLRWSDRTLRAKRRAGVFREGEHFYQPSGCHPRWDREALLRWLKTASTDVPTPEGFELASKGGRRLV